jgi:hypothetical protein
MTPITIMTMATIMLMTMPTIMLMIMVTTMITIMARIVTRRHSLTTRRNRATTN